MLCVERYLTLVDSVLYLVMPLNLESKVIPNTFICFFCDDSLVKDIISMGGCSPYDRTNIMNSLIDLL